MAKHMLYQIVELQEGIAKDVGKYNHLLVSGGSDYRAYQVLRKREEFNLSFENVLLFDFEERHNLSDESEKAYNEYQTLGQTVRTVSCSIAGPSLCLKSIEKLGVTFSPLEAVAIDISCFTQPYFFSVLKYLKEQHKLREVTVFYTEPMSYIFSKGLLYRSYHSSYGPLTLKEIPGYPGSRTRTSRNVLVLLLGFDGELSTYIADELAPEEIIIVNGFPGYYPKFKDISLINNERLLGRTNPKYSTANNPFETFNLLDTLRSQNPDAFLTVAPIGPKPMALGACLFAIAYSSVRVVYPVPEHYANKTTDQCWKSWKYHIPFVISHPRLTFQTQGPMSYLDGLSIL